MCVCVSRFSTNVLKVRAVFCCITFNLDEMSGAQAALVSAENEDANQYAPVPMDRARDKLRRAEQARLKGNYAEAKRLAEEAQADAELAQAIANKSEAETALREMEISIEVLREEIMRGQDS